jgi:hypothetical protein
MTAEADISMTGLHVIMLSIFWDCFFAVSDSGKTIISF